MIASVSVSGYGASGLIMQSKYCASDAGRPQGVDGV